MPSRQSPITERIARSQEDETGLGVFCDATQSLYSYTDNGMLRLSGPTDKWPPRSPSSQLEFAVEDGPAVEQLPVLEAPGREVSKLKLARSALGRILTKNR